MGNMGLLHPPKMELQPYLWLVFRPTLWVGFIHTYYPTSGSANGPAKISDQRSWQTKLEDNEKIATPWKIDIVKPKKDVWFRWFAFSIGWFLGSSRFFWRGVSLSW